MVDKKPFNKLLHSQYQSVNLQQDELFKINKAQKKYRLKEIQHKAIIVFYCCLFFVGGAVSWYQVATPSAHEIAMLAMEEHNSLPMAEIQTKQFQKLASYFYRLNVQVNPIFRSNDYWEWVGARRSKFFNTYGAHFYLRNKDTGVVESVFQFPYVAPFTSLNLRENEPMMKEYGSKLVKMHVLDGTMYLVTTSISH